MSVLSSQRSLGSKFWLQLWPDPDGSCLRHTGKNHANWCRHTVRQQALCPAAAYLHQGILTFVCPIISPFPVGMYASSSNFEHSHDSLAGYRLARSASGKPLLWHSTLLQAFSCPARATVHGVQILSLCSSRDLSSLACTCRVLRDLIFEDEGFSEPLW